MDEASVHRLAAHFAAQPIDGFILAATTGEGLVLDESETHRVVEVSSAAIAGRKKVFLGLCGSDTRRLVRRVADTAGWPIDGYLITCPYYSRPSQDGMLRHFAALADATDRPILVYNIPYRTGVNLANDTLLRRRGPGFAVLTGEDALFYSAIAHGADGGILASAHLDPAAFAAVHRALAAGALTEALAAWSGLVDLVRLLFAEPNPAPIKHCLARLGLIASPELRLPMTGVSAALATELDRRLGRVAS